MMIYETVYFQSPTRFHDDARYNGDVPSIAKATDTWRRLNGEKEEIED